MGDKSKHGPQYPAQGEGAKICGDCSYDFETQEVTCGSVTCGPGV